MDDDDENKVNIESKLIDNEKENEDNDGRKYIENENENEKEVNIESKLIDDENEEEVNIESKVMDDENDKEDSIAIKLMNDEIEKEVDIELDLIGDEIEMENSIESKQIEDVNEKEVNIESKQMDDENEKEINIKSKLMEDETEEELNIESKLIDDKKINEYEAENQLTDDENDKKDSFESKEMEDEDENEVNIENKLIDNEKKNEDNADHKLIENENEKEVNIESKLMNDENEREDNIESKLVDDENEKEVNFESKLIDNEMENEDNAYHNLIENENEKEVNIENKLMRDENEKEDNIDSKVMNDEIGKEVIIESKLMDDEYEKEDNIENKLIDDEKINEDNDENKLNDDEKDKENSIEIKLMNDEIEEDINIESKLMDDEIKNEFNNERKLMDDENEKDVTIEIKLFDNEKEQEVDIGNQLMNNETENEIIIESKLTNDQNENDINILKKIMSEEVIKEVNIECKLIDNKKEKEGNIESMLLDDENDKEDNIESKLMYDKNERKDNIESKLNDNEKENIDNADHKLIDNENEKEVNIEKKLLKDENEKEDNIESKLIDDEKINEDNDENKLTDDENDKEDNIEIKLMNDEIEKEVNIESKLMKTDDENDKEDIIEIKLMTDENKKELNIESKLVDDENDKEDNIENKLMDDENEKELNIESKSIDDEKKNVDKAENKLTDDENDKENSIEIQLMNDEIEKEVHIESKLRDNENEKEVIIDSKLIDNGKKNEDNSEHKLMDDENVKEVNIESKLMDNENEKEVIIDSKLIDKENKNEDNADPKLTYDENEDNFESNLMDNENENKVKIGSKLIDYENINEDNAERKLIDDDETKGFDEKYVGEKANVLKFHYNDAEYGISDQNISDMVHPIPDINKPDVYLENFVNVNLQNPEFKMKSCPSENEKNIKMFNNDVEDINVKTSFMDSVDEHLELLNRFPVMNDVNFEKEVCFESESNEFNNTEICEAEILPTTSNNIMNKYQSKEINVLDSINDFPNLTEIFMQLDIKKEAFSVDDREEIIYPTICSRNRANIFRNENASNKERNTEICMSSVDIKNDNTDDRRSIHKTNFDAKDILETTINEIEKKQEGALSVDSKEKLLDKSEENIELKDEISNLVKKAEKVMNASVRSKASIDDTVNESMLLKVQTFDKIEQENIKKEENNFYEIQDSDISERENTLNLENSEVNDVDERDLVETKDSTDKLDDENQFESISDILQGSNNNAVSDDSPWATENSSNDNINKLTAWHKLQVNENVKEKPEKLKGLSITSKIADPKEKFQLSLPQTSKLIQDLVEELENGVIDSSKLVNQEINNASISGLLTGYDYLPIDITEDVIQRARETVERISNRRKSKEKLNDDNEIVIDLNELEEWINFKNQLMASFSPSTNDDLINLETKEKRINEIIMEIDRKTCDLETLEVKLEQHSDNLDESLSDSLRSRFLILRRGVNSTKLLTHETLAELENYIKDKQRSEQQSENHFNEDKLNYYRKSSVILVDNNSDYKPDEDHKKIFKALSNNLLTSQNLLEDLKKNAEIINIPTDLNEKTFNNDLQQDRVVWKLLLSRCKSRYQQVKEQSNSQLSKRLSPSFFVIHTDKKVNPLAQIKEEVQNLFSTNKEKSNKDAYQVMKLIESASQIIENKIINNQLLSVDEDNENNEAKTHLLDILNELSENDDQITKILNSEIYEFYKSILNLLKERLKVLDQCLSNDAHMQTINEPRTKEEIIEKSIQTYVKNESKRVSILDIDKDRTKKIHCHKTEYCDKLSELLKKSYDLRASNPNEFDLQRLGKIDSEMHFIALNLKLSVEMEQILESNYQYEQLLNNYNQFLLTGTHKLHGKLMTIKNFADMKTRVIQFKDYFSNFHVYRESLESLRMKVSSDIAKRLSDQHLEVIKRSDVLEEQAHEKFVELLHILYDWSEFERNFKELKEYLVTIEKTYNDNKKCEIKSQSDDYLFTLESLNRKLVSNSSKVGYTLSKGKNIINQIYSTDLKTDIEEFFEKWQDISSEVSLVLKDEKNATELSYDFETKSKELEDHMDTIHEITIQVEEQIQKEQTPNFQNIIQRQSSVFHLKQRFFSQENLKKSVLKIGDSLLKTKRYNLTRLNRKLCSLENKWEGICDRIRDLEEMSMSPVFISKSFEIPKDDVKSLVRSIEMSLEKLKFETTIKTFSDLEALDEQLKFLSLKLCTVEPLIDLYCQRNPGLQSDSINKAMTNKSEEIHNIIDESKTIYAVMKDIDEQAGKIINWTSQSNECENIVKNFNSKMNVKLGITKIKSLQETSNHHRDHIEQIRSLIKSLISLKNVIKVDTNYISEWLCSIETALFTECNTHSNNLAAADLLLQHWKELEKYELTILEKEIDIDHFIGESKSLIFSTLNCVKFHSKNLNAYKERLFGKHGAYAKYEEQIELIKIELHKNLKQTMKVIFTHPIPTKTELINKITSYSNHLSDLLDHWELFNDYIRKSTSNFEQMEALIIESFNPQNVKQNFNLPEQLNKVETMIKESQNLSNKLMGVTEYLIKILDQNTMTKLRNTLSVNSHRLYRIKKYKDSLKNKLYQHDKDLHFFDSHCQRMEKINNKVEISFSLIMPSKLFDSSFDHDIIDLLKNVIESRRDINEIKSISHPFVMDQSREKRLELIIVQRTSIINKILQTIQDRDIENCAKMEFMALCNYCMDLMRFLEPQLQYEHFNNFDEVIEQQLCFEFLQLLTHPKESLFLILIEKGSLNESENCGHFQTNLNQLKRQWSNIIDQINNSKQYLDKTVSTYLEFLGKLELFRLWCDNLSDKLIDFESDIWSVDEMKHLQFRLAILTQERDAHIPVYEACLATGENVFRTTLDNDTKSRIQEDLQELHEKWCNISDQLLSNSEKLIKRYDEWYTVDESIQNLFAWIKEISIFTTSDIPYYEGLNLNLQKSEKFMADLKSSQSIRLELRNKIYNLVCYLSPDDVTILFNRVYLIDKQCNELAIQIEIRRREIQSRMSVWPQFIDDCRKLTLELTEVVKELESKEVYQVKEKMVELESEIIPTVNEYKLKFENLKSRGIDIQEKSGEDRSKDISYRLQKFEDIWNNANTLANNKLKELQEIYDSFESFEENSRNLKKWMLEMKESLNSPIFLQEFRIDVPMKLLEICKIQHENIQSHSGDVKSLLLLCNLLMHNVDACPNHSAKEEISKTRKKLKKRWENINNKINFKMIKLNEIISVWKTMEIKLTETDYFINQIDGRLNNLVANINTNPDKNLDKIQILKNDINEYESEIRSLLETYDMMSAHDQLDSSGQIDDQTKNLRNKFETIHEEISVLDAQMKQMATVKLRLNDCCETIKSWIIEVDKEITLVELNQPNTEMIKMEFQDIKLHFHEQLRYLKEIEAESKSLLNNSHSDSLHFSNIVGKLKKSEQIIHNLSIRLRNSIRPASRKSSGAGSRSSARSSISFKSNQSQIPSNSMGTTEAYKKANGLVQELNCIIADVDQYLVWTNKLLESITDIKTVVFEDSLVDNKNFNSFVDLIVTSRYKVDLIRGLNDELSQLIHSNHLKIVKNYSAEAVEDIQIRWKTTYDMCVKRDKNDFSEKDLETPTKVLGFKAKRLSRSSSIKSESLKLTESQHRKSYDRDLSFKESEIKQSLEQWIKESLLIVEKKSDFTNLSTICKLGLTPIKSELESLKLFLNDYIKWNFTYNEVITSSNISTPGSYDLLNSWKDLRHMVECWIVNMQKIVDNSPDVYKELSRITDQIRWLKNESRNIHAISDTFIDQFDEVKNYHDYWKTQIKPISRVNRHNLTMNRKLTEKMDKFMKDLINLDSLVLRISQAIIESDNLKIHNSGTKRPSSILTEDDVETTAPILTSASFSDDDLANNSSLMIPSISSFEQPYVPIVSDDLISGDTDVRLRVANKLLLEHHSPTADPIMPHSIDDQRLAQGDVSHPIIQSEDLVSVSTTWTKKLCGRLLILIILFIILVLFVKFMLLSKCENNWECSSPLSGVTVKKHWSKSAAV